MSASEATGVWELTALPNWACHPVTPQTWPSTILVVSHDRNFLNAIATDIIHLHSQRLDGYRGDFETFIKSKQERLLNQQREYEAQQQYRQHIQVWGQAGLGTCSIPWVLELWGVREPQQCLNSSTCRFSLTGFATMPTEPLKCRVNSRCWRSCEYTVADQVLTPVFYLFPSFCRPPLALPLWVFPFLETNFNFFPSGKQSILSCFWKVNLAPSGLGNHQSTFCLHI